MTKKALKFILKIITYLNYQAFLIFFFKLLIK